MLDDLDDIDASDWLGTPVPLPLAGLRGRVVLVTVFQMLCPGCVLHSLPQARRVHEAFARDDVVVLGLHSVFEHPEAMTRDALAAFAHEWRWPFPIAVDRRIAGADVPATMHAWGLRGTPSLRVYDREGALAFQHFGHVDDLRLGAVVGRLVADAPAPRPAEAAGAAGPVCRR